jgi:ankyrin repeat protein
MNDEYEDPSSAPAPSQREIDDFVAAAGNGHTDTVTAFLDRYTAFIDQKNSAGSPALVKAAAAGLKTMVELLLSKGAQIDARDKHDWTALTEAAQKGRTEVVAMLLEKGAEIDTKSQAGWTPLMWAARMERLDIVTLLLEKGASTEEMNDSEKTAQMIAKMFSCQKAAELLEQWPEQRRRAELDRRKKERDLAEAKAKEQTDARLEKLKNRRPPKPPFKNNAP